MESYQSCRWHNAFQDMLKWFGLTEKVLTLNADSATSNDTQTTKLDQLDNLFHKENQVRCFNHTLQLSAKALLTPFNAALSDKTTEDDEQVTNDFTIFEDDGGDEGEDEE